LPKIHILNETESVPRAGYAGEVILEGEGTSQTLVADDLGVWLVLATIGDGARLSWPREHGEEAVYIREGGLRVANLECVAGSAVVVGRNAGLSVEAIGLTRLVHFGTRVTRGTPVAGNAAVHLIGPGGRVRHETGLGSRVTWFADSTDARCDLTFFLVDRPPGPADRGMPHTHSQDEVIFVMGGEVSLGAQRCRTGTALGIPAGVRYALSKSSEGFAFLNYRPGASVQTVYERGEPPRVVPESGMERGGTYVGDVRTLSSVSGRST
jgi:hypothetical protein